MGFVDRSCIGFGDLLLKKVTFNLATKADIGFKLFWMLPIFNFIRLIIDAKKKIFDWEYIFRMSNAKYQTERL